MKYSFIQCHRRVWPISMQCRVLKVSVTGYHQHFVRRASDAGWGSGIATHRAVGLGDSFAGVWIGAWLTAWLVAFPVVLVVAPLARRTVSLLVDSRP